MHISRCTFQKESVVEIKKNEKEELIDNSNLKIEEILEIISTSAKEGKQLLDNFKPFDLESTTKKRLGEALYLYLSGKLEDSEILYKKILEDTHKTHGENHLDVLRCYEKMALIAKKKRKLSRGHQIL